MNETQDVPNQRIWYQFPETVGNCHLEIWNSGRAKIEVPKAVWLKGGVSKILKLGRVVKLEDRDEKGRPVLASYRVTGVEHGDEEFRVGRYDVSVEAIRTTTRAEDARLLKEDAEAQRREREELKDAWDLELGELGEEEKVLSEEVQPRKRKKMERNWWRRL